MYENEANAEVRRLRLMATSTKRHRSEAPIARGSMLPTISSSILIATLVAACTIAAFAGSGPDDTFTFRSADPTHEAAPSPTLAPTVASTPSPSTEPTENPNKLVAAAQRIKPLEDIQKGDRVIYQRYVCTWLKWDGDINTSTITCGKKTFQIQTGRLTPVELKDAPSKLKVRHGEG